MFSSILLIGFSLVFFIALIFFIGKGPMLSVILREIERRMRDERERLTEQFHSERELFDEKMKKEEQFIVGSKDAIKELVERIHQELARNQQQTHTMNKDQLSQFSSVRTMLEEHKALTADLKQSTDNLKNLLSHNQLRGKYGQEVAENLLRAAGFVKGQNYLVEKVQDSAKTRPDFTILLPDKTKIHIDVKFPLDALLQLQQAERKVDQEHYFKQFKEDVKQKVREVATRDYINPEENTVDFAILFVPSEMVFSYIYDNLHEVWDDAMHKKVILAGPFSFTAILRMVFQAYTNFSYQKNIREITNLFRKFDEEFGKYSEEVDKLGGRIEAVSSQYNTVSVTRTKKLSSIVEKIKSAEIPALESGSTGGEEPKKDSELPPASGEDAGDG